MKLNRFQRPKKKIVEGFRPNKDGALPIKGKEGITNQKGAFGG